ncbi:hypothetical protein L6164_000963 [Bauhinia variegata]|uniref:Uncharacterized protein n=1 Tax=Bauhinia variegata TaxID=167791 RepID=A0ACB9Q8N7_BAUVA|nr:hypothetical protein L6164_000963 [Bauhinia variegata]
MAARIVRMCLLLVLVISSLNFPSFAVPLSRRKPWNKIKEINQQGPYVGLITVFETEENAFFEAGAFELHWKHPFVDLSGRLFRVGKIYNMKVIYVRCGEGLINAAATTQQMVDVFEVIGIVHFGIAGSSNNSLSIGDVTIPKQFMDTGLWHWLNPNATLESSEFAELDIGNYNVPEEGKNLLGRIGYKYEEFYSESGKPNAWKPLVWANVTHDWLQLFANLERLELERCVNSSYCLPYDPKIVSGLKASTADIFVDNAAYRDFLFKTFQVSSVDMESFAIVMTSLSNDFQVIVIRGISDFAGGTEESSSVDDIFELLAASNAVKVVLAFLNILSPHTTLEM